MPTWTDPRTWVTDELVTAAIMNTHVRDNFNASAPHFIVRKSADESVTSSAVLQDDNHLILALAANEVWHFRFSLIYTAAAGTGDLKVAFTFPASAEITAGGPYLDSGGTWVANDYTGTTSDVPVRTYQGIAAPAKRCVQIQGNIINAGTAGNLTLRWAQNTSSATATTLYTNSTLWAVKLA